MVTSTDAGRASDEGTDAGRASDEAADEAEPADESDLERVGTDRAVEDPTATDGEGLTPRESAALDRVQTVSRLLDEAVRVPGTDIRVGLDPVIGLVPVVGDAVSAVISLYPVAEAYRLDVPRRTLAKMLGLVAVDALAGSIPVVGDVFDAFWKANEWNSRALERHVRQS